MFTLAPKSLPSRVTCAGCPTRTYRPFWQDIGSDHCRPFCPTCARWITENFTAAAAIAEARMIITAARQVR